MVHQKVDLKEPKKANLLGRWKDNLKVGYLAGTRGLLMESLRVE